jgi:hypothetical protein
MTTDQLAVQDSAATGPTARALVVYESMFGNSRLVAEAVALGIGARMPVSVVEVSEAPTTFRPDIALVVAGGPTHVMGMSRPSTREDAERKFPVEARGSTEGLREWLASLHGEGGPTVAVFDTRIHTPVYLGSAARGASRRLRHLGFDVTAVTSFFVGGTTGPLDQGELTRARAWGAGLAESVARAA